MRGRDISNAASVKLVFHKKVTLRETLPQFMRGKTYKCSICEQVFSLNTQLKRHIHNALFDWVTCGKHGWCMYVPGLM